METICKENTNTISFLLIYGFRAICPSVPLFFFSIWLKFSLFFVYLVIYLNLFVCN